MVHTARLLLVFLLVIGINPLFADEKQGSYEYIYNASELFDYFEDSYIKYQTSPSFDIQMYETLETFIPPLIKLKQSRDYKKLDQELVILRALIHKFAELDEVTYTSADGWDAEEHLRIIENYKSRQEKEKSIDKDKPRLMMDNSGASQKAALKPSTPAYHLPSDWIDFLDEDESC